MKTIKRILWGVTISIPLFALLTGCKKYLDREPLQATLNDLNQGGLEGQAIGLYGAIRNSQSSPYCGDGFESIGYTGGIIDVPPSERSLEYPLTLDLRRPY